MMNLNVRHVVADDGVLSKHKKSACPGLYRTYQYITLHDDSFENTAHPGTSVLSSLALVVAVVVMLDCRCQLQIFRAFKATCMCSKMVWLVPPYTTPPRQTNSGNLFGAGAMWLITDKPCKPKYPLAFGVIFRILVSNLQICKFST